MKFIKFKHNNKIYLYEENTTNELMSIIINQIKPNYKYENIELMSSNVFKIKNKQNKELKEIFND